MTRLKLIAFLTYLLLAVGFLILMFWLMDSTVGRNQKRWNDRTALYEQAEPRGLPAPRTSKGD